MVVGDLAARMSLCDLKYVVVDLCVENFETESELEIVVDDLCFANS